MLTIECYPSFPDRLAGKESACKAGDPGSIPGMGSSSEEVISYPLQYFWASLVAQKVKESQLNAGDLGSIPDLGKFPGGGHGNPLQCSCLENSMDRGAWRATVYGITKAGHD